MSAYSDRHDKSVKSAKGALAHGPHGGGAGQPPAGLSIQGRAAWAVEQARKAGVHSFTSAPAPASMGPGIWIRTKGKPGSAPTPSTFKRVKTLPKPHAAKAALAVHKASLAGLGAKSKPKVKTKSSSLVTHKAKSSQVTPHDSGTSSGASSGGLGGGPAASDSGSGFSFGGLLPLAGLAVLILVFLWYLRHRKKGRKGK
jgi:hypothetical protein